MKNNLSKEEIEEIKKKHAAKTKAVKNNKVIKK